MPPRVKTHRHCCSKTCTTCKNPRVILRPLLADSSGHGRYRFTSLPASASLFNRPELSDIRLTVGDHSYYAHRLVLCAASEVFANMLDERWLESRQHILELQEEEECTKHFDRFLQYMYTGSIVISESYVLPLFMLADKYVVKPLYGECVKIIENGLKVYLVTKKNVDGSDTVTVDQSPITLLRLRRLGGQSSEDSSESDMSDQETGHENAVTPRNTNSAGHDIAVATAGSSQTSSMCAPNYPQSVYLVASEIFPLVTVIKMLLFCHDDNIKQGALYNLEARLSKQLSNENYGVWNDISQDVIVMMLQDTYFYCKEFMIFKAVKSWLQYSKSRLIEDTVTEMFRHIRYPILSSSELYRAEKDPLVKGCPRAVALIHAAIRYQLFKDCAVAHDEKWVGPTYQDRTFKQED